MTIVVLGARGYLGANLIRALRPAMPVVGISRGARRGPGSGSFDRWTEVLDELLSYGPATIVNAIAIADHAACERDPAEADRVNHLLAARIAAAAAARNVPLVHISTDGLFGQGRVQNAPRYFSLHDTPIAINAYARTKLSAEEALRRIGWGHVLRLSFVGDDAGTGRGLVRFIAGRIKSEAETIEGYVDSFFTPVHVDDVARAVGRIAGENRTGFSLAHLASTPAMTKFSYVRDVVDGLGARITVAAVRRQALPGGELVPVDQSLASPNPVASEAVIAQSIADVRAILH